MVQYSKSFYNHRKMMYMYIIARIDDIYIKQVTVVYNVIYVIMLLYVYIYTTKVDIRIMHLRLSLL